MCLFLWLPCSLPVVHQFVPEVGESLGAAVQRLLIEQLCLKLTMNNEQNERFTDYEKCAK